MSDHIKQPAISTTKRVLLFTLVFFSIFLPRIFALDRFVTVDESEWLFQAGNFYYALGQNEWEETYRRSHPGVTALWAGVFGYLVEYPEHRGSGAGYLDTAKAEQYFRDIGEYDKLLPILSTARAFIVFGVAVTLSFAFYYVWRLLGIYPAIIGMFLIAFDPYHIALSRVLHHDSTLGNLMFLSSFALLAYFYRGRRGPDLVVSAVAAGVSMLAKAPGIFMFPFAGLVGLIVFFFARSQKNPIKLSMLVKPLLIWSLIIILTFIVFWPAMWVAPFSTLSGVFNVVLGYAEQGHGGGVYFYGERIMGKDMLKVVHYYPVTYLWHITPVVMIGLILAAVGYYKKWGIANDLQYRHFGLILILFSFWFFVFMSLGAKKLDRYMLPVYLPLSLISGVGWLVFYKAFHEKFTGIVMHRLFSVLLFVMIAYQVGGTLITFPYYFSYFNPVLGGLDKATENISVTWGQGLDLAGRYLNAKPNAENLVVMSPIPYGNFTFFFDGETIKQFDFENMDEEQIEYLRRTHYIVRYGINSGNSYTSIQPEYVGKIQGVVFVAVYNKGDFPMEIYQGWLDNLQEP